MLQSREWRLANLYQIKEENGRVVPFKARAEQLEFRRNRHTRNYVAKGRKLGISTEIVIENLDEDLFPPEIPGQRGIVVAIVDRRASDAEEKLAIAKLAWDSGPYHPNPEVAQLWRRIHALNPLVNGNGKGTQSRLDWKNGSEMHAGVSFTGRTPQRVHISEYGPIAAQSPKKAAEIQRGTINACPVDGIIDIETTLEGGRFGLNYKYFKLAKKAVGKDLSVADYRLFFFPWYGHPSYRLAGRKPTDGYVIDYFKRLNAENSALHITPEQQAWYQARWQELGDEMLQQYPSTIDECDKAVIAGAIYPQMASLRAQGRVTPMNPVPGLPLYTSSDLGNGDHTASWLIQVVGRDILILDYFLGEGDGAAGMADAWRAWEALYGRITRHIVPHDAETADRGSGKDYVKQLVENQIPRATIAVTPRVVDVWIGIGEVRKRIPRMYFHPRCDEERRGPDDEEVPGGVARLEGYRRKSTQNENLRPMPHKDDVCDHIADALRYFCEADSVGIIGAQTRVQDMRGEQAILCT